MTGRSDYGSQSWRYPALLAWAPWWQPTRRGSQAEILAGLRRLLGVGR